MRRKALPRAAQELHALQHHLRRRRLLKRKHAAGRDLRGHVGVILRLYQKQYPRARLLCEVLCKMGAEFIAQRRADDDNIIPVFEKPAPCVRSVVRKLDGGVAPAGEQLTQGRMKFFPQRQRTARCRFAADTPCAFLFPKVLVTLTSYNTPQRFAAGRKR